MTLESWADWLRNTTAPADVIHLHIQDTLAAFFTGLRTQDGCALARRYRGLGQDYPAAVAAIARLSECDDIHLASCVTPGSVVIPVALAFSQNRTAAEVHHAISAGYAAGLSWGQAIGGVKALARGVWPTLFVAPVMAAVTAALLNGSKREQFTHVIAQALNAPTGRVSHLVGTRWQLFADAVTRGLRAADSVGHGSPADQSPLSKNWLAAQAGHDEIDISALESPSASISQVGFKPFPIARQGANAVIAFQRVLARGIEPHRIDSIEVFVPVVNVALLTRPVADDRLSRLANLAFQLACAALASEMLYDSERAGQHAQLTEFAQRVTVHAASDLEGHMPERWPARAIVTAGKDRYEETVTNAPFDYDAPELASLLTAKWRRLLNAEESALIAAAPGGYPMLWQAIERLMTMAAEKTEG